MIRGISAARANELFCRVDDDDQAERLAEHLEGIQEACGLWNEANPELVDGKPRFVIGEHGRWGDSEWGIFDNKREKWIMGSDMDFPEPRR